MTEKILKIEEKEFGLESIRSDFTKLMIKKRVFNSWGGRNV